MFEQRLRYILSDIYAGRILVISDYTARETLFAKGMTPAIFLHKFYSHPVSQTRVVYTIKERLVKELCELAPIDAEEYDSYKEERINRLLRDKMVGKSKLPKEISRKDLTEKQHIENYLKSLNFFWFEEAARIFLYGMSLDENNFKLETLTQPLGLVFLIEIFPNVNLKAQYERARKDADMRMRKIFVLNYNRVKSIPSLVILIYNAQKGGTLSQMKSYQQALRQQYNISSDNICLVQINGSEAKDSIEWSSYPRVVIKTDYKLQPSDPVRIMGDKQQNVLREYIYSHRERIRRYMDDKMRLLCVKYQEVNTTKNKFFNFFKGATENKQYLSEQVQMRELADSLYLLGDYRRALDVYKDLADKCEEGKRESAIVYSLGEMVTISKFMNALTGGNKSKSYESIVKFAEKSMFKRAHTLGKLKLYRYELYIMYILHGLKIFERDFVKNCLYYYLKRTVNEQSYSEHNQHPSLIPCLVHEQYANLNLLYPIPQFRRYAYDVIRVASKFYEFRLYEHHLRCLLIASYIYEGTFPPIQKYLNSSLSKTYLELKKYRSCVERIQHSWRILLTMYQENTSENEQDNQFTKLYSSQVRCLNEIQKMEPQELNRQSEDCIPIPKVSDVLVEVWDQNLDSGEGMGSRWQEVGDPFLSQTELTSKGMNKKNLINMLKIFDAFTPEERELAYRTKTLPNGQINQAMLKRNTRPCYLGEPITVTFSMKNYIPLSIDVSNINLHLKANKKCKIRLTEPNQEKIILKPGQKLAITFELIPLEVGLFELSHISWTFFKMTSIYRFKQTWESKSPLKSLYYKLNVVEECGKLGVDIKHANKFYEGEQTEIQLQLSNKGSQEIEEVYLAIDNQNIFGFRMKKLDVEIPSNKSTTTTLKIKLPILKSTNFMKCLSKGIFLYRTGSQWRVQRTTTIFNVQRVAEIINLSCERISTTLHFLSFTVKYPSIEDQKENLLKSMVIHCGMDIKKVETNQLGSLIHYFFFLRKNSETKLEEHKFNYHDFPSLDIIKKTYLTEQNSRESDNSVQLFFIWWDKKGSCGVIQPKPVTITSTQNSPSLVKLPFNAKVMLKDEVQCNFAQDLYAELEVEFIIKNLFSAKDINLAVQFIQGAANDFYWEGITQHHLCLKFNQEKVIKLRLLVTRAGLYNIARNIRYTIMINKTNSYMINHSDYENIYLDVKDAGAASTFDFFDSSFKKQQDKPKIEQSQSLI